MEIITQINFGRMGLFHMLSLQGIVNVHLKVFKNVIFLAQQPHMSLKFRPTRVKNKKKRKRWIFCLETSFLISKLPSPGISAPPSIYQK